MTTTTVYEIPRRELEPLYEKVRGSLARHMHFVYGLPPARHHLKWIEALENSSIDELLIVAPPRHAKSTIICGYLSQEIGRNPSVHIGYISNTAGQADRRSVAVRETIEFNKRYNNLYGIEPEQGRWTKNEWCVKRQYKGDPNPTFISCGMWGPILGSEFDILVFDDVIDEEIARSRTQMEKALEWIRRTALTRKAPGCRVVHICTRWAEKDFAAYCMEKGWRTIVTPAIGYWEPDTALWPEVWPLEMLLDIKDDIGAEAFELIYQGKVLQRDGGIFRREYFLPARLIIKRAN